MKNIHHNTLIEHAIIYIHSGSGSITLKRVGGISFCEIKDNEFGITPSMDGRSYIKMLYSLMYSAICIIHLLTG